MQHFYGIDLDRAMSGEHSAGHVAALAYNLPNGSILKGAIDPDAGWSRTDILTAMLVNDLNAILYGLADRKSRGPEPTKVGPSWMTKGDKRTRKMEARVMSVEKLMEKLNQPRRG